MKCRSEGPRPRLCGRLTLAVGLTLVVGLTLFAGLKWRTGRWPPFRSGTQTDRGPADSDPADATASQNAPDEGLPDGHPREVTPEKNDSKASAAPTELDRALALARHSLQTLEKVKDYTC